jgi:hypothetical protein
MLKPKMLWFMCWEPFMFVLIDVLCFILGCAAREGLSSMGFWGYFKAGSWDRWDLRLWTTAHATALAFFMTRLYCKSFSLFPRLYSFCKLYLRNDLPNLFAVVFVVLFHLVGDISTGLVLMLSIVINLQRNISSWTLKQKRGIQIEKEISTIYV